MSYEVKFNVPYPIHPLFFVGAIEMQGDSRQIALAICWAEGHPILYKVRNMNPIDLQKLQDEIVTEVVKSMQKRIPAQIIVKGPTNG